MISGLMLLMQAAGSPAAPPVWGSPSGIQVAIYPRAIGDASGDGGPRGLLRIGYPILPPGKSWLVNFIAIEPVVAGRRGYSELEPSASDGRPGKLIALRELHQPKHPDSIDLAVEKFDNGAHLWLRLTFTRSHPDEVTIRAFAEPDSAPIEQCALTATMGNFERIRRIDLKNGQLVSTTIYNDYQGNAFAADHTVPLKDLTRDRSGAVLVPCHAGEDDPRSSQEPLPPDSNWRYPGIKVEQYWKAPPGSFSPLLHLRVNARKVYWMSTLPLPGGIAFENIELRDRFRSGQPFIFGIRPDRSGE